jgi:surface carbohydrate biosynthesis protein
MNRVIADPTSAPTKVAREPVVLLVDNKIRDLNVAVLLAHHLETIGVTCHLEPLESFRAAAAAHRPGMIVFNHLNASHLARFSWRLKELGIQVGVLPNEGFVYDDDTRPFMAGHYHKPHVDHFFCWNEVHAEALRKEGVDKTGQVHVVGAPRFDFYFEPWSKALPPPPPKGEKPRVLLCTNFVLARFTREGTLAENTASDAGKRAALLSDYGGTIEAHQRGRERLLDYLDAMIDDGRFEIVLRPHPNEDQTFYEKWLAGLSPERRSKILYVPKESIASLILSSDLEISCETCTTAVESWIARKPTIALMFEKHPLIYRANFGDQNFNCDDPSKLPQMIAEFVRNPEQAEKRPLRDKHLARWAAAPDGKATLRIALAIAQGLDSKQPADWSKLDLSDRRRALKLKAWRALGWTYAHDPLISVKYALMPKRYAPKYFASLKNITPRDVARAKAHLFSSLAAAG